MSAVTRPRGPLPSRVYWTRRLLVLLVAVALVVGISRLLDRGSGRGDEGAAAPMAATPGESRARRQGTPPPTPSSRPDGGRQERRPDGPRASARGDREEGERERRKRKRLARPDGPCADSDLLVTPVIGKAHAGAPVKVVLEVTTVESAACTWEVGPESVFVSIAAPDRVLWSSQHCPRAIPTEVVVPRRAKAARVGFTWDGRESDEGCAADTAWVLPGGYTVTAVARGSVTPVETAFELAAPVAPTVTRTPTPTATPTPGASRRHASTAGPSATDEGDRPRRRAAG